MNVQVKIKPMSVNEAWKGRRYKTNKYKAYEQALMLLLPKTYEIPAEGDLEAFYEFGISPAADWDNPVKPLQDVLQKKYNFDDKRIVKGTAVKTRVKRGEGFIKFSIKAAS